MTEAPSGERDPHGGGSGRRAAAILAALGVAFFGAFALQRARSGFLAAEARLDEASRLAARAAVPLHEVLALHELFGGRLSEVELARRVTEFAEQREALGDPLLAVLAVRGRGDLAARLRVEAGGDAEELHRLVFACREAVDDAVRFASVSSRFAARGH